MNISNSTMLFRRTKTFLATALAMGLLLGQPALAEEPVPNTYVDVPAPQLTGWNDINRLTVDGVDEADPKTYIYTDAAAKALAEAGGDLNANSPAQVYWELDDGSGRTPGIQVVTDDFAFPTNNCIMASGERETDIAGSTTIVPKTCSDAPSSAKRYFLEIVDADTPVDMVFDVGVKDIRYGGVKDPVDDGGEALAAFREEYGIGRIYRVIQKVINNTDQRLLGIRVEVGHGVGDAFVPFNYADDGVAFELRPLVPREFFEGETGAPDIAVWNEERFATFSPKLFDTGERDRFDPGFLSHQAAGLFPPQNVQGTSDKTQFIFSGNSTNDLGYFGAITQNYFSMADAQANGTPFDVGNAGIFGYWLSDSLATYVIGRYDSGDPEGESDAVEAWWDGTVWRYGMAGDITGAPETWFGEVELSQLEQWATKLLGIDPAQLDNSVRYATILSDDLANLNMDSYIYIDEGILDAEGNPKYDSITYRVTAVPTPESDILGNKEPAWVSNPAPELATYLPATGAPVALNDLVSMFENDQDSPYYEDGAETVNIAVLGNDLLDGELLLGSGATVTAVNISNETGGTIVLESDNTVSFTAAADFTGLASFTYTVDIDDGAGGSLTSNEATVAIRVSPYPDPDAPVARNDSAVTFQNTSVTIDVLANDTLPSVGEPSIAVLDEPLTGTTSVVNDQIVYTPADDFAGLDRFTYTVIMNGKVSNAALITVRVDEPQVAELPEDEEPVVTPASSSSDDGFFGCSYNPGAPVDPSLLVLALGAIGGMVWRNRRRTING